MSEPAAASAGAVAGVTTAVNIPAVVGAVSLPSAGSGGGTAPSSSLSFLLVLSGVLALAGAVFALMGRKREVENDGIHLN